MISTSDNTVGTVGSQNSRGAELETGLRITRDWTVSANATYTHSRYGTFTDPQTGGNDAGNRPPDVPIWTAAIFTKYANVANLPLDIGGDIRYIDNRAGDFANTLQLDDYELVEVYTTYRISKHTDLIGRIDNLLDKSYVSWADTNYPTEVILGQPRYSELDLHVAL